MPYSISKPDSSSIKGFLTILIIIGHNHIIAPQSSPLMAYLYTFHVACFFILPWMYNNKKELTIKNIGNIIYRNWIPYMIFFVFSLGVLILLEGKYPNVGRAVSAFVTGSQKLLKENTGFFFLWFLPTFCTFSIMKLAAHNRKSMLWLLTLLSIMTFCVSWREAEWMKNNLPFGIYVALRYFVYGAIAFLMLRWREWTKYVGAAAFVVLSYLYWAGNINRYGIVMMPIIGFMFIISVLPLLRMKWLRAIGEYSLPIYLTHVYIYNTLELVIPNRIFWGILALIMTVIIAYILSIIIYKINFIRILVFPRSFKEWKSIFFLLILFLSGCTTESQEKFVFIGDSIVRNWDIERYMPFIDSENFGVDGYRIKNCRNIKINDIESTVVLLVGTNDLVAADTDKYAEDFTEEYIKLVDGFTCKRIICISILPKNGFEYETISDINKCIESKLKTKGNCVFLNVAEDFLYDGGINPEYTVDGLHLNTKGYDLLSSKLSEVL